MSADSVFLLASFSAPEQIGTTPQSMLWLFPLAASIAIVYKTIKLEKITTLFFLKEVTVLFGSIIIFMAVMAVALSVLAWLIM
ncbi:MAG: hypothetical protein ACYSSL_00475 [Planctomycetota bacterium]|jgi:hypothetical protein